MGSKAVKSVKNVVRRSQAEQRQEERSKLSNEEQLAKLDVKLGVGVGAAKERTKLAQAITKAAKKVTAAKEVEAVVQMDTVEVAKPAKKPATKKTVQPAKTVAKTTTVKAAKPAAAKPAKKSAARRAKTS